MGRKKNSQSLPKDEIGNENQESEPVADAIAESIPEVIEAVRESESLAPKHRNEISDLQAHPKFDKFKRGEN